MNPLNSNSIDEQSSYKLSNDFNTIKVNDIDNVLSSDRVQPRQISTGNNRGEMTVKGLIRIVGGNTKPLIIMGYKEGGF